MKKTPSVVGNTMLVKKHHLVRNDKITRRLWEAGSVGSHWEKGRERIKKRREK
jgi:hypothetical protein